MLLAQTEEGRHLVLSRSMALRVTIILRITATMMTLGFLPAAARPVVAPRSRTARPIVRPRANPEGPPVRLPVTPPKGPGFKRRI